VFIGSDLSIYLNKNYLSPGRNFPLFIHTIMLEFVFKRKELDDLIESSGDPDNGNVVIRLAFSPGENKVFQARVTAFCEDAAGKALGDDAISGCPRPPGCE
jgi:hypothetical protein